jgi:hypothetical protein
LISRGRHNGLFLYEVTEQDLLLPDYQKGAYRAGNVLIFSDKRNVSLGQELARADDIIAAREYLDSQQQGALIEQTAAEPHPADLAALTAQLRERDERLQDLTIKIEQRDELLRDLADNLKNQKQDNELLYAILEATRERLAVEEASREELVDDLQQASAETLNIDSTLERVLEEKFKLEQELAESITELMDMNLRYDDLKRHVDSISANSEAADTETSQPATAVGAASNGGSSVSTDSATGSAAGSAHGVPNPDSQILTMPSGKQIHIYHEFPSAPRPSVASRFNLILRGLARSCGFVVLAALVLLATSIFATAKVNGCSFGEALDLLLKSLGLT